MSNIFDKISFLESNKFVNDLINELSKKPSKIKIICFRFSYKEILQKIYPSLLEAAKQGSSIELELDAIFSRYNLVGGIMAIPLIGKRKNDQKYQEQLLSKVLDELRQYGASVRYLNEPNFINKYIFPFAKRDHRKIIFLESKGKKVLYFGAINLDEAELNDYMIKIEDEEIYEKLIKINSYEFFSKENKNMTLEISESLAFFLDIGLFFNSIIQKNAYGLIREAKKFIRFVSQHPPEPGLIFQFVKAKLRGVNVEIVIPDFRNRGVSGFPYVLALLMNIIISKIFSIKLKQCTKYYTHAKVLVCDDRVLLGSHNLSNVGVWVGTREFSVIFRNKRLWTEVQNFVNDLVDKNTGKDAILKKIIKKTKIRKNENINF